MCTSLSKDRKLSNIICPITFLLLSISSVNVFSAVLEEVIVTAQKREQSIQDVGISITALSGEQISQLGFSNASEIVSQAPGVDVQNTFGPGFNTNYVIRGAGINNFNDGIEAPTVAYIDEFYILPIQAADFLLYDLERAEVLRGPQGTLFGRNSNGGLLHWVTRKPHEEFEAYTKLTVAEYDQIKFEGALNIPINENLIARASAATNNHDGYVNRVNGGPDGGESDIISFRGQLLFKPTENLEILAKGEYGETEGATLAWENFPVTVEPNGVIRKVSDTENAFGICPGCDYFGYSEANAGAGGPWETTASFMGGSNKISHGLIRMNWDLETFNVTAIGGALLVNKLFYEDCDGSSNDICRALYDHVDKQYTAEIRLNGEQETIRWTAGFYYLNEDFDGRVDGQFNFNEPVVFYGPNGQDATFNQELDSWALFGQIEYDFAEQWTVLAGIRYTEDDKEYMLDNVGFIPAPGHNTIPEPTGLNDLDNLLLDSFMNRTCDFVLISDDCIYARQTVTPADIGNYDDSMISVKVELDWRPVEDLLLYASYSRGEKGGGFNTGFVALGLTLTEIPFETETLNSYEIGFKSTFWDGRARLNGSAFYYDYDDYQAAAQPSLGITILNTGASAAGGEIELQVSPTEQLDIMLGASFIDSEVEDISNAAGFVQDTEFGYAADFTLNGLVRYEWPVWNGALALQGDFNYVGDREFDSFNNPSVALDSYILGNARLDYSDGSGKWQAGIFVKNIGDDDTVIHNFDVGGAFTTGVFTRHRPRWFGGEISVNWK